MVRARWRGLSSGSSTTGRTFLFGSLMKASSLPGLFPCGDFGDRALHVLDELVRVLAALGEETVQLLAPRRAQLALVRDGLVQRGERSEEHTSELQSLAYLVCRLLLEKKKKTQ